MPFNEALFWIGLTVFGTGFYFLIDRTQYNRWLSWVVALSGACAVVYSIYVHSHHDALGLPLWFYLLCLTWVLVGLDIYARRSRIPIRGDELSAEAFRNPKWDTVTSHNFENEAVGVDGKRFVDCRFRNAKLVFHGKAPTEFLGNTKLGGTIELTTDHAATMHYLAIETKLNSLPGGEATRSAVDAKGNAIPGAVSLEATPTTPAPQSEQSLQKKIFELCSEITRYIAEQGQRPDEDKLWNEVGTAHGSKLFISRYNAEIQPWDDKLAAGYWLRFRDKLVDLRHELTLKDCQDEQLVLAMSELDQHPTKTYMKALRQTVERFRYLASTLDD
jgi:hypothetical protein